MTSDVIIDNCLLAIGEIDPDNPVYMTRVECLAHINQAYREEMGPILNKQALANPTVTDGVADLPADFLAPIRVYDGAPDDGTLLIQIFDIQDKVDDDDETQQYRISNEQEIHFYGKTPDDTIYLYYIQRPEALTDSSASSPVDLKSKYHYTAFTTYVRAVYARNRNENATYERLFALWLDILDDIKRAHSIGRADITPRTKRDVWS